MGEAKRKGPVAIERTGRLELEAFQLHIVVRELSSFDDKRNDKAGILDADRALRALTDSATLKDLGIEQEGSVPNPSLFLAVGLKGPALLKTYEPSVTIDQARTLSALISGVLAAGGKALEIRSALARTLDQLEDLIAGKQPPKLVEDGAP